MASPATDVFLSYKAEDRARLKPLVDALEAEGFTVWWDARIGGGTNWQKEIEKHLDAAKCVLVAWTKRSVGDAGHFVRDEARRAQRRGAYLPIRLDLVQPPLGFGEIQALPLKGWKGDPADPLFRAVADAVRDCLKHGRISGGQVQHYSPPVSRRFVIVSGAGVAAAAATGAWFLLRPTATNAKRIAVMPFANLSGSKDQDYFAEGVAEELRSALIRIGLQVIGRASSDAVKDMDTKTAAARLDVAYILAGSIRRSASTMRINAQLLSGSDGVERWAESYDRTGGDEIKIQTDIAANVAQALNIALGAAGRAALTIGGTADDIAHDLFLRARRLFWVADDSPTIAQSIALLDAAIARDPNYAEAYWLKSRNLEWLGNVYSKSPADTALKLSEAEAAARKAIALAPRLGSAFVSLARIDADRLQFASAYDNMRRGLAVSPGDREVIVVASLFMQQFGDSRDALRLADRLISLDPLQAQSFVRRAEVLYTMRDYAQSIALNRKILSLSPDYSYAHLQIANCLLMLNRLVEAKIEYAKLPDGDVLRLAGEAATAARGGDRATKDALLTRLRAQFGEAANYQYAQVYAQSHDLDDAFAAIDKAVAAKDAGLQELKVDPLLDPIRADPRYAALLKRLKFPA